MLFPLSFLLINWLAGLLLKPANKSLNGRHSGESRHPGRDWMPDQVRHDRGGVLNCRVNKRHEWHTVLSAANETGQLNKRERKQLV
jgi:hypothetical protein